MGKDRTPIGRGRGVSTNVPEQELIEQVRCRPLLYDKNSNDYRKPGLSEGAWGDVADVLQTSVANCKKRWKSLRDTFIKYYRIEMCQKDEAKRNKRPWIYYRALSFLIPHIELYRLDESSTKGENRTIPIYLKDDDDYAESTIGEEQFYFTEEDISHGVGGGGGGGNEDITYQIKISDEYDERNEATDHYEEEERLEEGQIIDTEDGRVVVNKVMEKFGDERATYVVLGTSEQTNEDATESREQHATKISTSKSLLQTSPLPVTSQESIATSSVESTALPQKNVTDPDERYLLSCLPAFKRFTPQQKAYVRMGIERLFYEVEFENIEEPRNKRQRNS